MYSTPLINITLHYSVVKGLMVMSMSLRNYCCNDDKTAHTTNNFNGATYITKYAPGKQYMNYQISNVAKNTQN